MSPSILLGGAIFIIIVMSNFQSRRRRRHITPPTTGLTQPLRYKRILQQPLTNSKGFYYIRHL